ncbi:hypothetical protein PVK06_039626 [Gossypium arboreum]|uniref:Uncharacterized protein n=1 Tax=Gossypium arboreum TaxID=29729 RepID=A0ABR0N3Z0_GOSAR|nr:hypothetical protein PVK06_039626 [Gossypium arboreum]
MSMEKEMVDLHLKDEEDEIMDLPVNLETNNNGIVIEFSWNLDLKAQSRRVVVANSVWLCEEGDEEFMATNLSNQNEGSKLQDNGMRTSWRNLNPILGFNLEGFPNIDKSTMAEQSSGWVTL